MTNLLEPKKALVEAIQNFLGDNTVSVSFYVYVEDRERGYSRELSPEKYQKIADNLDRNGVSYKNKLYHGETHSTSLNVDDIHLTIRHKLGDADRKRELLEQLEKAQAELAKLEAKEEVTVSSEGVTCDDLPY